MKKSVFTLLAIAFAVITMSSCSQNDGGSSNDLNIPEKLQSNKVQADKPAAEVCECQVAMTNDVLEFFDVTITRNVAGKTTTLELSKDFDIYMYHLNGEKDHAFASCPGKTMDPVTFSDKETLTVKVTPKANWQSILDARAEGSICFRTNAIVKRTICTGDRFASMDANPTYNSKSEINQKVLNIVAEGLEALISLKFGM